MVLDIMGNQWQLADGVLSIVAAGEGKARVVATPVTASSFACDFGGFVWIVAEGNLYRLNPRGPGYTDNGMGKRDEPGDEPIECVGAFDGDYNAHTKWTRVAVPTKALSVRQPSGSDHPIVMLEGKGEQEVSVSADGTVRLRTPAAEVPGGWRTLPGVLPCSNHDIAAAVVDGMVYVCGGAIWYRGYPAAVHMLDEIWRFDPAQRDSADAWTVVAKTPSPIAFSGIAALGSKLYIFGGCKSHNDVPNDRSTHGQLWIYDIPSGIFTEGPDMITARQECGGATLNGRVYAFGWDKSCESIGEGETTWRAEAACPVVMGGSPGMGGQFNCTVLDGIAYFAGPFGLLSFSPTAGWDASHLGSPTAGACPLVAAHKGEIYVMSGFFYDPTPGKMCDLERAVHSYNPSTRQWTQRPPLPCCEAWGAGASVGDTLFAIGGSKFSRDARTFCFDNRVFAIDI